MKIGIIGSATVGQTLAQGFLAEGHAVVLGTRDTTKTELVQWQREHAGAELGSFEAAASEGDIVLLAVKGPAAENAIQLAGIAHLAGKVVIDATNPIAEKPPVNGVLHFFTTMEESLMERLQRLAPEAKFVKAFNSVGAYAMYKPQLPGGPPSMFICGNDELAKKTVSGILTSFGWETEDMGAIEAARAIEPLCMLWCIPGFLQNRWTHAFKLLKP